MFSSLSKPQRKIIFSFLLLAFVLTILHYTNPPSDARDPNEKRVVVGLVAIVAGVYMAASEATDRSLAGVGIGAAVAGSGLYILMGSGGGI